MFKMPVSTRNAILLTLMVLSFQVNVNAQQEPQFTQNMFNYASVNPGYYGLAKGICVTGLFREQWLGFKDEQGNKVAPETFLMNANIPVKLLHGGAGIGVMQDKYGFFKDLTIKLGYSYHINVGDGQLGIGANINILNKSLDFTKFIKVDQTDPVLQSQSGNGVIFSDMSAGIFLSKPKYYLSVSGSQLLESSKTLGGSNQEAIYTMKRHYYAGGGYDIAYPDNPSYVITPSVFFKTDGAGMQVDFNAMVTYNHKVWGGASYRINDAVAIMAGMAFKDLEIGYSYDIPMTRVGSTGSHEIMVRYCFQFEHEKARKGYRNTRFL
jgi:type IX secretion system PorP/SprF family membrane protein